MNAILLIGEIKYMITLHKKNIFFFYKILDWEIFPAILGKFRGNSDWDWGQISAPNRVQKNPLTCEKIKKVEKSTGSTGLQVLKVFIKTADQLLLKKHSWRWSLKSLHNKGMSFSLFKIMSCFNPPK